MTTRLTYTSGGAAPETDAAFEAALEAGAPSAGTRSPTRRRRADGPRAGGSSGATRRARHVGRLPRPRRVVADAIERARAAQVAWRRTAPSERCTRCCARWARRSASATWSWRPPSDGGRQEPHGVDRRGAGGDRPDRGLLRPDRAPRRLRGAARAALARGDQPERAAAVRRVRRDRAVQLPRRARHRDGLRRAGRRQHGRDQAVRSRRRSRARSSARRSPPPGCPTALSTSCTAARRPAARSPTARSTASCSRARPRSGARSAGASRGAVRAPGDHRDGRQEPGDRGRDRRPRRRGGGHRRVGVRLLGPEVQRLLARDRARRRARRAGRAARGARGQARRRRPGRPRAFTGPVVDERAVERFNAAVATLARRHRRRRRPRARPARPLRRPDRGRDLPAGHRLARRSSSSRS